MDILNRRISQAGRRNFLQSFLNCFAWLAIIGLAVALVAVAIPKIWPIEFLQQPAATKQWFWNWVGGSLGVAFLSALLIAWYRRSTKVDLAIEIDKRFRLRERVSSAILMNDQTRESSAGEALLNDATKRASTLEIAEQFPIRLGKWAFSVLIPALGILALSFVADRIVAPKTADEPLATEVRAKIAQAARESKMKLQNRPKPLEENDPLAATEKLLVEKLEELANEKLESKKEVLFRLSDMQSEIDKQKSKLGDVAALKKELSKLGANESTAKDLADALRDGKFDVAKDAVKDLVDKINAGKMDQKSLEQLNKDLAAMAKSMEQSKKDFEQKQNDLSRDLEKALADGDTQRAEQIKKQLEDLQEGRRQMDQLDQLAKKMQKAAGQLAKKSSQSKSDGQPSESNPGDANQQAKASEKSKQVEAKAGNEADNQAAPADMELDEMEGLAEQIADLEAEAGQCDRLEEMADLIKGCKGQCQNLDGKKPGDGLGEGRGEGERPFGEDAANLYKSQVRAKVQPGETAKYGTADGPNAPGVSRETIKQQIASAVPDELDPLKDQKLTKAEREHLREYYQKLRDDQN